MKASVDAQWAQYGRALIDSMSEVLAETPDEVHANLLETADYWLSLGLVLGLRDPSQARQLLQVIEAHEAERGELERDATGLIGQGFAGGVVGSSRRCTRGPDSRTTFRRWPRAIRAGSRDGQRTRSSAARSAAPDCGGSSGADLT